jgi:hypothetical protein
MIIAYHFQDEILKYNIHRWVKFNFSNLNVLNQIKCVEAIFKIPDRYYLFKNTANPRIISKYVKPNYFKLEMFVHLSCEGPEIDLLDLPHGK